SISATLRRPSLMRVSKRMAQIAWPGEPHGGRVNSRTETRLVEFAEFVATFADEFIGFQRRGDYAGGGGPMRTIREWRDGRRARVAFAASAVEGVRERQRFELARAVAAEA